MFNLNPLFRAVTVALGFTPLAFLPTHALGQQQSGESELEVEEVIVTGTRIFSVDGFGRTSPVTVVPMEDISSYGLTRVEDVLNNLPQIQAAQTAFISNGATGTASVDLRGLGPSRTLVLINGRRLQPGGVFTETPDINQIPSFMIERVDVLTGGASATYGADAVAGVVNFITRRIDGVEFRWGMGGYQHNNDSEYIQGLMDERNFDYPTGSSGLDGKSYNFDIALGGDFADGRGNATVFFTWRKNEELRQDARDYSSCALNARGTRCSGSANTAVPNFFIAPLTEDGEGPYGYDWYQEWFATLTPASTLVDDDGSNRYNFAPVNHFMRPDERWSAGAFANFEINAHAITYLEILTANNDTRAQVAESGTFFSDVYPLPLSNSLFPEAFRASLAEHFPGEDEFGIYIGKRNVEGGPRSDVLSHNSLRIVAGLKGALSLNWDYDVSYLHGQTHASSTYINDFLEPRIGFAVDGELCAQTPGCIPYEVFTYQGVTPEAAAALTGTATATASTSIDVFNAYVTGDTGWGLDAGNVFVAGGFEWRQQKFDRISDTLYEEGALAGQGGPIESLSGSFRVKELFIEGNIPLLADRPWARMMVLDLAYRWSDYTTVGVTHTYRIGLDWQVTDAFRLRTGYNRAVRAPRVAGLFSPTSLGLWSGVDPCAGENPQYTAEQCALTGVSPAQYGNITPSPAGQYNGLFGGNPDLDVEKADTWTAGIVIDPVEAMQVSIDYWNIKIDDVMGSIAPALVLEQCGLFGDLCESIHRAGNGSLWQGQSGYVQGNTQNLGQAKWVGIDLAWAWQIGESWQLDLLGTYMLEAETTPIPNDPESAYDCVGLINAVCFQPEWRHTFTTTYDSNSWWAVTARWRYYSKLEYTDDRDELAPDTLGSAYNYVDLNAVFRFLDTHDVIIGVNNILDKTPPLLGNTLSDNGNTAAGYYDTLGRYLFANLTLRW